VTKDNYYILTGAMGGGKSTVIRGLKRRGLVCVEDPARQILEEQRSIGGRGVPETDASLFNQMMLSRAMHVYKAHTEDPGVVLFDRGIPDLVAYAGLFGIDQSVFERAASRYTCNSKVFYFPGWPEIYAQDDERKMDFAAASRFGETVAGVYERLGYRILTVPLVSIEERERFIVDVINGRAGG
jgi:predicted ATPase